MEYSHDKFWLETSQRGFDFDTADSQSVFDDSKQSAFLRNDESNQFNRLRYNGLDEIVEDSSSADFLPLRISAEGRENYALKFRDNSNPLLIFPKKGAKVEQCVPEKTVRNMILGLEYSLSEYKSKKTKIDLLDAAENTHDGNTIIEVVLYLRNTLKKSIFQREIMSFPGALNVYLAYLEENHETDELTNMLLLADKAEDAAFIKYEAAVTIEDPKRKLQLIENCLSTYFQMVSTDSLIHLSIEEHCRILKEHIKFMGSVDETEMMHFENVTGKKSVIDSSVICSLIYSCLFYYKSQANSHSILTCPQKLKTNYNLTKKQFTWAAIRTLTSLQKWSDIDDLFMSKNWRGSFIVRSCISFSRVLEVLFKGNAPSEVLSKYVSYIENEQEKLQLAQKYACHSIAIDVLKNNKDRLGLIKYKSALDDPHSHSPYLLSIIEALNNPIIRWKN